MIADYLRVVYASFKKRKLRSWLTLIGIFIGIATVVSLISLGEGLRSAVMSQFDLLNPDVVTIRAEGAIGFGPPGEGVTNPLQEYYLDDIRSVNGVDVVMGRVVESAKVRFNGRTQFVFTASYPDDDKDDAFEKIVQIEIEKGSMLDPSDTSKVVIGHDFTQSDLFGEGVKLRDNLIIDGRSFKVKGILKKQGSFIIDQNVIMSEDVMRDLYDLDDTYDAIAVLVSPGTDMPSLKVRLEDYLRDERDVDEGEEDFNVQTPDQALSNLDATLFAVQMFVYIIASISLIIGGIGIANTMYTSVLERTKEIGIIKAIGATNKQVFILFVLEAGLLGTIGGIIGVAGGAGIATGLAALGKKVMGEGLIDVQIGLPLIIGSLVFSFLIGSLAGITPALRASRLKPVEALRQ